ncbi:MAG: AraC family transcriptional regulator [Spirochaetia bacterium]|nr:AraC family transcriptional regulator [Spirochaetia bacterium]
MQLTHIPVDGNMRCLVEISRKFPAHVFTMDLSEFELGCIGWHWHPEVEFIVVAEGSAEIMIGDNSVIMHEGDTVFINAEALHMYMSHGKGKTVLNVFIIHPELFSHGSDSLLKDRYIDPVIRCTSMSYFILDKSIQWCAESCSLLETVMELESSGQFGFEFAIRNNLCELWYKLITNTLNKRQNVPAPCVSDIRIKKMMSYIHENYDSPVTLESIAFSGGVSKSECYRIFKKHLSMKPFEYLTKYRIDISMHLLKETDLSIAQISSSCGFNSSSYFTKMFRQITSLSPNQYRHKNSEYKNLRLLGGA